MAKKNMSMFKRTVASPEVVPDETTLDLMNQEPPGFEKPLSKNEQKRLAELEGVVTKNFKAFYEVGCALREIQQLRLYRQTHTNFADYANDLWDLARSTAYQYIYAADVVDNVRHGGQFENVNHGTQSLEVPQNERQARLLVKYKPEDQVKLWRRAVHELPINGKMTASHLRKTAINIKLEKETKAVQSAKKAIEKAPNISPEFNQAYRAFLDQINVERSKKWKETEPNEAIRALQVVIDAMEAEL